MEKGSIWSRMFRAFIKDAEPDEIDEAVAAMNAKGQDAEPAPAAQPEDPTEARFKSIEDSLAKITDSLAALQRTPIRNLHRLRKMSRTRWTAWKKNCRLLHRKGRNRMLRLTRRSSMRSRARPRTMTPA